MSRVFRRLSFVLLILPFSVWGQASLSIIPEPVSVETKAGVFRAGPMLVTMPRNSPEMTAVLDDFSRDWRRLTGRKLVFSVETGAAAAGPG
ncbi:MAG: hypothetical protein ABUM51_04665, partial [Bacteroidota bacterium]